MKKIIHFKFEPGKQPFDVIQKFADDMKNYLSDYTVIITPFDLSVEDENDVALNLNGISYTHAQL